MATAAGAAVATGTAVGAAAAGAVVALGGVVAAAWGVAVADVPQATNRKRPNIKDERRKKPGLVK